MAIKADHVRGDTRKKDPLVFVSLSGRIPDSEIKTGGSFFLASSRARPAHIAK